MSVVFCWALLAWPQFIFIVFAEIIVGEVLVFGIFLILSAEMQIILFWQRFFIKFQIGRFLVSISNEASIGLPKRFDGCLLIICFHSHSTPIVIFRILLYLERVFELTGRVCVLVFNVGLWFTLTYNRFFPKRVLVLLEVFHWGFHLV